MVSASSFKSQQIAHQLVRHPQSGLSIAQYCKEHSLNPVCFYNRCSTRLKKAQQVSPSTANQQTGWIELTPPLQFTAQPIDTNQAGARHLGGWN